MLGILLAHLIAALLAPLLVGRLGRLAPWLLGLVPVASAAWLVRAWAQAGEAPLHVAVPWVPELGAEVALRADGLAVLMVLLVGLIGGLVCIYAGRYLQGDPRLGRFFLLLLGFIGAMLGLVLADNVWWLFICWELTSITSFFLIGFKHKDQESRDSAQRALLVTGAGGLALMGGLAVLVAMGRRAGLDVADATAISSLLEIGPSLTADPLYPLALGLILLGAFTKSAQVPFHHWLPLAMAGPTPVSALLHSATMVKAGVFLLARLHPALGGTLPWVATLTTVGTVTMIGGALLAVGKRDLKSLLAYTTVSGLGTLVMLLGLGTDQALAAMVVFLAVHALYKSALFLVVGNVDHAAGTRDVTLLGGLGRLMPVTAAAALIAALGKAGAPPALGYMGKKLALQAKFDLPSIGDWLTLAAVITNIAMVATALVVAIKPFRGRLADTGRAAHEAPVAMVLGPVVLAVAGLLIGLVPSAFDTTLGAAAASAIAGHAVTFELKVWSGLNLESLVLMGISLLAFGAGYLVYRHLHVFHGWAAPPAWLAPWLPARLYSRGLVGLSAGAGAFTRTVQGGRLRTYVAVVAVGLVGLVSPWLWRAELAGLEAGLLDLKPGDIMLVGIIAAGAVGAMVARRPIAAAISVGVTGLGLAAVFALDGGIDLAITQLLVEALVIVILAAVLVQLPRQVMVASRRSRLRDLAIAAAVGVTATGLVLLPHAASRPAVAAERMLAWAVPEAHGRNVVNVILVDFRALDTLGEAVVVAAAAATVLVLLRRRHGGAS